MGGALLKMGYNAIELTKIFILLNSIAEFDKRCEG
jgi:hypothetical protein